MSAESRHWHAVTEGKVAELLHRMGNREQQAIVRRLLQLQGLDAASGDVPAALSGGQSLARLDSQNCGGQRGRSCRR